MYQTENKHYVVQEDFNEQIVNLYQSFFAVKMKLIQINMYKSYKSLFLKGKFFLGSTIINNVFNLDTYNKLIQKIKSLNAIYPTKHVTKKLVKYFFNYRYLWRMDLIKDNMLIAGGFRKDVAPFKTWMKQLSLFLLSQKILKELPDIIVINKYIDKKSGLGLHLDHNFVNYITSISFGNDTRLDFRNGALGDWGFCSGLFCITIKQNCVFQMDCSSFIVNNVKHMVKYTDLAIPRYVIILRNIDPKLKCQANLLQKYRNNCVQKWMDRNLTKSKIFQEQLKYCKNHNILLKDFHNYK